MAVDVPGAGATVPSMFLIAGWAGQAGGTDSGVDAIHVWAFPVGGGSPIFVGTATLGGARPDVAAVFGGAYANSGFNLIAGPLPAGTYDLVVYVHNARTGRFTDRRIVRVIVTP
jgi:hypothetical protein